MAQLALYVDDKTARQIDEAASKHGMSRSAWVRLAIHKELEDGLPDSFFQVLGTWEDDDLSPEQILQRIRANLSQAARAPLE